MEQEGKGACTNKYEYKKLRKTQVKEKTPTRIARPKTIHTWKLGTWNIRSIQGKDKELEEEFEKAKLQILAITETKKKGTGMTKTKEGHIMIYSGVDVKERAAAGVACMIHKYWEERIVKYIGHSERILSVLLAEKENKETTTVIIAYGPNEDELAEKKEKFWEQLNDITEEAKGQVIVAGDLNGRVGKRDETCNRTIGPYGEDRRTDNGRRILNYCQTNDLIVTNTFYQHKDIHRYTREVISRNEKSIIDYILVENAKRKSILDTKVQRGPEIGSDHYMVIAKIRRITEEKQKTNRENEKEHETIKTYKLRLPEISEKYGGRVSELIDEETMNMQTNIEGEWRQIRNAILKAAQEVCGKYKTNKNKKQTKWWTNEVKEQIKMKKKTWKKYLDNKNTSNYDIYKKERKKAKEMVIEAKRKCWEEFGNKMEKDSKENQKLFYNIIKKCRKEKGNIEWYIKNKKNEVLKDDKKIMERWKEYFQELLQTTAGTQTDITEEEGKNNSPTEEKQDEDITETEIKEIVKNLKNGKAPGEDKTTTEMFKYMRERDLRILTNMYKRIWKEENIPEEWTTSLIVPIFKKGDKKQCNNYRGITLVNTNMKILEQIIERRIRPIIEKTLDDVQSGFRKGKSIQDHIFSLKQIIEKKRREDKTLYLGFIDLEKAFDKVPRRKLWKILRNRGVSAKITRIIQTIYENNTNRIIYNNQKSETFKTSEGLRQGGGLSPILFITYMDEIIKEANKTKKQVLVGYRNLQRIKVDIGAFADDIVLIANTQEELNERLNKWDEILNKFGMTMNKEKTKVMTIGKEENISIKIENTQLEQITEYKYLGTIFTQDGKMNREFDERITKTTQLYYQINKTIINKKEISKKTKLNIYKTIYRPTLTFGCESWTLTAREKNKMAAMEMKYLRRVKGVTIMDKIRSSEIREELEIEAIEDFMDKRKLSWWGHLNRMKEGTQVKQVWEARAQGKRRRGRPNQEWDKTVTEILTKKGISVAEAKHKTKNKKEWAKFVYE